MGRRLQPIEWVKVIKRFLKSDRDPSCGNTVGGKSPKVSLGNFLVQHDLRRVGMYVCVCVCVCVSVIVEGGFPTLTLVNMCTCLILVEIGRRVSVGMERHFITM